MTERAVRGTPRHDKRSPAIFNIFGFTAVLLPVSPDGKVLRHPEVAIAVHV